MGSSTANTDVLVVGGGLCGLGSAAYLARAGLSVRVLERASTVGGRASTERVAGFALNRGPHALYRRGEAKQVLTELGVPLSANPVPARGQALRRGELHRLPVDLWSLFTTSLLGWNCKAASAKLFGSLPRLDPERLPFVSVAEWLDGLVACDGAREIGHAFCRLSTYVNRPELFSAATALRQIQKALSGVLYVDDGWQTLADGLASSAEAAGARIECEARLTALEATGRGYELILDGGRRSVAKAVVLAIPPSQAAKLLESAGVRMPSLKEALPVRMAALDVALAKLPRTEPRFVLGMDQPLYFSVHSSVARLAPAGGALIHVGKYLRGDESDPDADRAELEGLLDQAQPGWRKELVHVQYLPRITVAERLDLAAEGGASARPAPEVRELPGIFLAGDWVQGGSWLADGSLGSARATSQRVCAQFEMRRAVA
jgi:phytoene dehydrogenase-like protein